MGEVYRATDSRLGRDVAIKVSHERFSERFDREARAIASLNHPNICTLYDVGPDYLVMEYIEGESPRGPMPVGEALAIASQIADALAAAHEKGIVHRDLKPANIKIAPDGTVKVLDFGLAKAGGAGGLGGPGGPGGPGGNDSVSPTLMSPAMTQAGMILGTAAYMAPEQARGKPVDARADIWAFGVVLYELLTGQRLFKGEDLTETLASVVKDQPDLSAAPARVRRLLDACLQKDPKKRLQSIGDMRLLLQDETTAPPSVRPGLGGRLTMALAGLAAAAMLGLAALAVMHFGETPPVERSLQLSVPLPDGVGAGYVELSPDGTRLLMALSSGGLHVRSLDSGELQPLTGTIGARSPFWSPDSRFIGFFAEGKLKVMPAAGGPAQILCGETGLGAGGTWNRSGVILFASDTGQLARVDAKGGACTPVTKADDETRASSPVFHPDGDHFFYFGVKLTDAASGGGYLATLEEPVGRKVLSDVSSIVYAPPVAAGAHSHLLFLRERTLMAQPFDDVAWQPVGDPFAVAARGSNTLSGVQVAASVASDGTLVYVAGVPRNTQLTWFDRSGKVLGTVGQPADQVNPVLSPDGNSVLTTRAAPGDVPSGWMRDLVRDSESRLTPAGAPGEGGLWAPDGNRVLLGAAGPQGSGLYEKNIRSGELTFVRKEDPAKMWSPSDWSRAGRLIYTAIDPKTRADIWSAPIEGGKVDEKAAVKILGTDAIESQGQVSPDGKWLAYVSTETGIYAVYLRAFPTGSQVWKVAVDRSLEPRWRADGKELYFKVWRSPLGTFMTVTVDADERGGLRVGVPQRLFDARVYTSVIQNNVFSYSPHPDGQRLLVDVLSETGEPTVNVITHWQQAVGGQKARDR